MMGKSGWIAGPLLGATLLISGAAGAQTALQPRQTYPQATDQEEGDDGYAGRDEAPEQDQAATRDDRNAEEDFSDVVAADEQRHTSDRDLDTDRGDSSAPSAEDREADALTNACALAARDEAEREGGYAEIRQMEAPRESREGFSIDGDVETRTGWRAQDGRVRHFTCTVANGRVEDVYFQRERAAR